VTIPFPAVGTLGKSGDIVNGFGQPTWIGAASELTWDAAVYTRFKQIALCGCSLDGSGFKIGRHGGAPKKE